MNSEKVNIKPPQWPLHLFRWFCRPEIVEDIEGDLLERFNRNVEETNLKKAKWKFIWQVILLCRPGIIRSFQFFKLNHNYMLRHNFLMAWRNAKKDKSTFLINLLGLSTGMVCALLITLWVHDELKVDTFHEKNDQFFEVLVNSNLQDNILTTEATPDLLAGALVEELPEVETATFTNNHWATPEGIFTFEEKVQPVTGLFAAENFFEVMTYPLLEGSPDQALTNQNNVVISDDLALRFFGSIKEALGKVLVWNFTVDSGTHEEILNVAGIFKSSPSNSSMKFDAVVSYNLLIKADKWRSGWTTGSARTFVVLDKETDIDVFNSKITNLLHLKHDSHSNSELFVQQFSRRYLHGFYENGQIAGGRIAYVRLFSIIAMMIIMIACINFMNLSTAQASKKMKEIGVKKTMGASKLNLIHQFISESTLVTILSFTLALGLTFLLIPTFNMISGKQLAMNITASLLIPLLLILSCTTLIAGSYPAFYLSNLKPLSVLKSKWIVSSGEKWIRKGLVIFQFGLSLLFIVGALAIHQQIKFVQKKYLGYNRENIISFSLGHNEVDPKIFIAELQNLPGVINAGQISSSILQRTDRNSGFSWTGNEEENDISFWSPRFGLFAMETLNMKLLSGRSFRESDGNDDSKVIINESARQMMRLENPIGFKLGLARDKEIIGVVRDFQYGSLHDPIEPLILRFRRWGREIIVRIKSGTESETIAAIEQLHSKFHPGYPFDFTFMDDDYETLYKSEQTVASLSNYFSILAIIISCLGLFGLSTYTAERKAKEISIRKILGASIIQVVSLLAKDFIQTICIGLLIGIPLSYILLKKWLGNFAYHIDLEWWLFALAAGLLLCIAIATIGIQTVRASEMNPVASLKDE